MRKYTSAFVILVISAVSMGAYGKQSLSENTTEQAATSDDHKSYFKDLNDRYSYAYGADLAEKFKAEGVELNVDMMAAAMREAFEGKEMKMPPGEVAATIDIYLEIHKKKKEAEKAVIGKKNKTEGEEFLAENAKKEGVVVTDSGLQYKVLKESNGGPRPTKDDLVTVHYRGTFIDGTEFDSTYGRNEPYVTKANKLIEGWAEALLLMSEGSKWELYIPADLAYGEQGSEPYVEPNATLIFEVELLEVEQAKKKEIAKEE